MRASMREKKRLPAMTDGKNGPVLSIGEGKIRKSQRKS